MSDNETKQPSLAWRFFGALFGRDKGTNGHRSLEFSNHKVFGTATLIVAVVLVCLGREVPWLMWAITAAFLGVAIATKALHR
jgi:hypothetical protein